MSRAAVQLENVEKTYRTGDVEVRAVRGITLQIEKGEFVAIMGSSGSGKSTLMNVLGCLDRPSKGRYLLDGVDVSPMGKNELASIRNRKIGFVFQNFNLLSRTTALENVELPLLYAHRSMSSSDMREKALAALDLVGLSQRADHHPSQLSGGQQQRVAIARALINDPEIIMADEATGNLDTRTSVEIMDVFQRLNEKGITVIMVTHELDIASYATRNIVVRDGLLKTDATVGQRTFATEELRKLEAAQQEKHIGS